MLWAIEILLTMLQNGEKVYFLFQVFEKIQSRVWTFQILVSVNANTKLAIFVYVYI